MFDSKGAASGQNSGRLDVAVPYCPSYRCVGHEYIFQRLRVIDEGLVPGDFACLSYDRFVQPPSFNRVELVQRRGRDEFIMSLLESGQAKNMRWDRAFIRWQRFRYIHWSVKRSMVTDAFAMGLHRVPKSARLTR